MKQLAVLLTIGWSILAASPARPGSGAGTDAFKVLFSGTEDDVPALLRQQIQDSSGGAITGFAYINARTTYFRRPDSLLAAGYKAAVIYGGNNCIGGCDIYGDSLAKYMDLGGAVIMVCYTNCGTGGWTIGGRFINQYSPVPRGPYGSYTGTLGTVYQPSHPIMQGVTAIGGANTRSYCTTLQHPAYSVRLADWTTSGYIQCAAFDSGGRRVVYLNYRVNYTSSMTGQWCRQLVHALIWAANPTTHDVGVSVIEAPAGALDSGASVTPACSVYNYGNQTEAYSVRMKIGGDYDLTAAVTGHAPQTLVYVTFPVWTAAARGSNAISCSTELTADATLANDRQTGSVTVNVHDVGATAIEVPTGTLDSGTTVTPGCSLFNYGTTAETYTARLKIGAGYDQTATVTAHPAGEYVYVAFPDWTAEVRGFSAVVCSTELTGDMQPPNDPVAGSVEVAVHDWAALSIIAPTGAVGPGPVTPSATVHNRGTAREAGKVYFWINGVPAYAESLDLSAGIPLGADTTLEFPVWTASTGSYTARCSVAHLNDQVADDNSVTSMFQVGEVDVAVTGITAPTGSHDTADILVPAATVQNTGEFNATFDVFFLIDSFGGNVYSATATVTDLAPGGSAPVVFDTWAFPHPVGTYATRCSLYYAGDGNPANNVATGSFTIRTGGAGGGETGWVRKLDLPLGVKSKKVKDGGALAYMAQASSFKPQARSPESNQLEACGLKLDAGFVYAFKGNGRYEFYGYNTIDNTWATLESIPAVGRAGKKKPVKKGSALATSGGTVYGAKGNNSLEWWAYDPALHTWAQKADVPTGAKNLKEGTGAVTVEINDTAYIYVLRGANSTDFHRYSPLTDAWESKAPAPVGASGKNYKNGSAIATDGTTIWALKGSYNELAAYDIATNTWATRTGMPLIGRLGKKKKVKDGAGMAYYNGYVFAQKGGNTVEFWKYKADTVGGGADVWTQIEDVPMGSGRNVKGGGALCYGDLPYPALYEFKGNNTFDFFKYGFGAMTNDQAPMANAGVQSGSSFRTPHSALRISPNPFSTATTISYSLPQPGNISLKLYDITGKAVATLAHGYTNAGDHSLPIGHWDLVIGHSRLARGIFIVRLETDAGTTTTKLIVE